MKDGRYQNEKLNKFRKRLHPIHIKNLKRLAKSYQEEIERLLEYSLVITEELEERQK